MVVRHFGVFRGHLIYSLTLSPGTLTGLKGLPVKPVLWGSILLLSRDIAASLPISPPI